jgi:hypothetical protein
MIGGGSGHFLACVAASREGAVFSVRVRLCESVLWVCLCRVCRVAAWLPASWGGSRCRVQ